MNYMLSLVGYSLLTIGCVGLSILHKIEFFSQSFTVISLMGLFIYGLGVYEKEIIKAWKYLTLN